MRKMNVIRSHKHETCSETVNKVALSANDDKIFIREDGIRTNAYWHWRLKIEKRNMRKKIIEEILG